MKPVFTALSLVCFFLVAGCAHPVYREILAETDSDYGAPPPEDYKELIKESFYPTAFDSVHAVYHFDAPMKGNTIRSRVINTKEMHGWLVCGTINSQRKLSGYSGHSGPRPFFALFKNEQLAQKVVGQTVEHKYAINRFNAAIKKICATRLPPEKNPKK